MIPADLALSREAPFDLGATRIPPGLTVLEASAGTGKTWSISHLVPRLILDGTVERLDQVLLLSFTDDATQELAERVRRVLADLVQLLLDLDPRPDQVPDLDAFLGRAVDAADPAKQAGLRQLLEVLRRQPEERRLARLRGLLAARLDADRLVVSTIHSLCHRILGDEGFLCGMPSGFEIQTDTTDLREAALRDVWRSDLMSDPLLAQVAASESWSLEEDRRAWRLLDPVDSERLLPEPPTLDSAKRDVGLALASMRAFAKDLGELQALLKDPRITLNPAGKILDFEGLASGLQALDPQAPRASDLERVASLAQAEKWILARGAANDAVRNKVLEKELVRSAKEAALALKRLGLAWRGHVLIQARRRLDKGLRQANRLSYNDLIGRLHRALLGPKGPELADRLRRRWRVALVDESQDSDPRQLAIFEAIFNRGVELTQSLVLIGDPKQSIFGFRSADLPTYEGARDRPGVPLHRLTRTHRSAEGLVRALNALFDQEHPLASPGLKVPRSESAKSDEEAPLPEGQTARLRVALVGEGRREDWDRAPKRLLKASQAAAAAISGLLGRALADKGRGVLPADCAVLVRGRRQAQAVRAALSELGIPAVLRDDGDVLGGEAAGELLSVLKAALKPGDRGLRRAALATRMLGLDALGLDALSEAAEEGWQEAMGTWGRVWSESGVAALLSRLDSAAGVSLRLAALPQGERFITDLRHLGELLQAEEAERRLAPDRLLHWLESGLAEAAGAGQTAPERLERLEKDGSAVQVLTVHRAKGLEFDFCFLPFLWQGRAPDGKEPRVVRLTDGSRALACPEWMDPQDADRLQAEGCWRELEEELRLAYVALTRARRQTWLLAGWIGYAEGNSVEDPSPLDWLLRQARPGEEGLDWYQRLSLQKKAPGAAEAKEGMARAFLCEHALRLAQLAKAEPLIQLEEPLFEGRAWTAPSPEAQALRAEPAPLVRPGWRITSFSALAGGGGGARGHQDPSGPPLALTGAWGAGLALGAPAASEAGREAPGEGGPSPGETLALSGLKGSARMGEFLHEVLERWDFQGPGVPHLAATLEKHGLKAMALGGRSLEQALAEELPKWAQAEVPGLGPLGRAASEPALSEWHFYLPLREEGLKGADLAWALGASADPRLRAYAPSLEALGQEKVRGMLQGYIDRLARVGPDWAVLDWKSNTLGPGPGDFSPERLLEEAAGHHYLLQLCLYQLALWRHLSLRDKGQRLKGACLVFLRALQPGTSRGMLHFPADDAVLTRLNALFAGVP